MIQLAPEQQRAVEKFQSNKFNGIAYWKQGEGKTRIALECWRRSGLKYLIVSTRKAAFDDWAAEIERCGFKVLILQGKEVKPHHLVAKFVVLQSANALHNVPRNIPRGQCMVVLDELYLFSNPKTKRSQAARILSIQSPSALGLSATIMPAQDNTAIWGQAKALGLESTLAPNLTQFRERFQLNLFSPFSETGEWKNKPGSLEEIMALLSPLVDSHFPSKENRNIRSQVIHINLSGEQSKAIKQLNSNWKFDEVEMSHTMAISHKIQGIGNGWADTKDGFLCYECPKFERLLAILEELLAAGERAVVWCAYRNDVEFLAMHLPFPTIVFVGGTNFNSKRWAKSEVKVVLATVGNGASVNHFADVEYGIYYSMTYRWFELDQSQGRHERRNSKHGGAFYYYLLNRWTLDTEVYKTVMESKNLEGKAISLAVQQSLQNQ